MKLAWLLVVALGAQAPAPAPVATPAADTPILCSNCDEWNTPHPPFKIHGRSYYVGTRGLSAVLIETGEGLILMDGGLPQSAPLITANIRQLGFRIEDVKLILNSHAHFDHAGGIARLQKETGAEVAASPSGAVALRAGYPVVEDPQFVPGGKDGAFPAVARVREVRDQEVLRIGDTAVKAYFTPGHTPGSTTWTWSSCARAKEDCVNIVYADSLNPVSNNDFRFSGDRTHSDRSEAFRRSIERVADLPCDIVVSVHPDFSRLFEKLKTRETFPVPDPFIDSSGCRTFAADASRRLEARLKMERSETSR